MAKRVLHKPLTPQQAPPPLDLLDLGGPPLLDQAALPAVQERTKMRKIHDASKTSQSTGETGYIFSRIAASNGEKKEENPIEAKSADS